MLPVDAVSIEVVAVLGRTTMPIGRLLRMGRGALIELDAHVNAPVRLYANDVLIAHGELVIQGDRLAIQVTGVPRKGGAAGETPDARDAA